MITPWVDRFSSLLDDDAIYARTKVSPNPLSDINTLPIEVAVPTLKRRLQSIYLPSRSAIEIMRALLGKAAAFSAERYGTSADFLTETYNPSMDEAFPVCVTGLAGVGKTQMMNALLRVLPQDSLVDPGAGHAGFRMKSAWHVRAKPVAEMLKDVLQKQGRHSVSDLVREGRRISRHDGVSLIIIDELQFHSMSHSASTEVTKALFEFSKIGIPLVYVCNYSLCNKFFNRPDHDRQRLLSDPLILLPDDRASNDWENYVRECCRVSGGVLWIASNNDIHRFYNYCFGLKRLAVELIAISYGVARREKCDHINIDHIATAYLSTAFSSNRKIVDTILKQDIEGKKVSSDLWCPFELPLTKSQQFSANCFQVRQDRMAEEMLSVSLTKTERKNLGVVERAFSPPAKVEVASSDKKKREGRPSLQFLIEQAESMRKSSDSPEE